MASDASAFETALTGGDDYEIVCAVPPDKVASFLAAAQAARVPVAEIGRIVSDRGLPRFLAADGKPIVFTRASFSHF